MGKGWGKVLGSRYGTYWRLIIYTIIWAVFCVFSFYVGGLVDGDQVIDAKVSTWDWKWVITGTGIGSIVMVWMILQVLKPNDAPIEMEIH